MVKGEGESGHARHFPPILFGGQTLIDLLYLLHFDSNREQNTNNVNALATSRGENGGSGGSIIGVKFARYS